MIVIHRRSGVIHAFTDDGYITGITMCGRPFRRAGWGRPPAGGRISETTCARCLDVQAARILKARP